MVVITDDIAFVLHILESKIRKMFSSESSGHDIYHLRRVMNLALHIQDKEGGDRLVIAFASFLHDLHRIMQNETGKYCQPSDSLPKLRELLTFAGVSDRKILQILRCVEFHEEYDFSDQGKTARDIETLILQDADNLDAIGAIGIARVFSFGGAHNIPIWCPDVPLDGESPWDETKPPSPSQIHHFHEKLLRLKDNMNTTTGRILAVGRHKIMVDFLEEFFKEWEGIA